MAESPSITPHPGEAGRNLTAKVVLGLSSLGVLTLPLYVVVDHYVADPIRSEVKRLVDENVLLYAAVVLSSIVAFGACGIVLMHRGQRPTEVRYRIVRLVVCVACSILLFAVALWIGGMVPIALALSRSCSLSDSVWPALVAFLLTALGAEMFGHRQRTWLRPLVWGAVAGSVLLLVQCLLTGWDLDLSL